MSNPSTMSFPRHDKASASINGVGGIVRACYQAWLRAFAHGDANCGH